jgi:hypothetical protein
MAQTGYTPILIYASGTASNVPLAANLTSSASGAELALNYADGKLYYKNSSGTVTLLASTAGASGDVVGPSSATDNALARFDLTTGKLIQNSVGILSDAGALSGITDISASGSITLSGGTANGVAYLNGSKVLTTGSALTWNASSFGIGTTPLTNKLAVVGDTTNYGILSSNPSGYGGINIRSNTITAQTWSFIAQDNGANSDLLLYGGSSAGTKLTIDSSGNLGLGVTPSAWSAHKILQVGSWASFGSFNGNLNSQMMNNAYWDGGAYRYIGSSQASYYSQATGIHGWYNAASGTAGNAVSFTAAMTLDASGNLLVGTTTITSTKLAVAFNGNSENGSIFRTTTDASGAVFAYFQQSTNICGFISRVGTTSAVVYSTTSDYRLKTVVGAVTGHGERIDALKPIDYQWKEGGQQARGFLAHEFQEVYASSVTGTKDAIDADGNPKYQAMQAGSSEVIADLVAEIQSLRKRLASAGI